MSLYDLILLTNAFVGMSFDLKTERIPNGWILLGWGVGICFRGFRNGIPGIISFLAGAALPVGILLILFLFRMLGPGDIKLFSVLGGCMGAKRIIMCMAYAFLAGAGISLIKIAVTRELSLVKRLRYFSEYLGRSVSRREIIPYYRTGSHRENIHFTIPIFISVLMHMKGVY